MTNFQVHDSSSAPDASKPFVAAARQKFGFVPNLIGMLAEAPAAAEAYLSLSDIAGRTSFTPAERHVTWFTINHFHACHYCMAAHTAIAKAERIDEAVVAAARAGDPYPEARLEALRVFTLAVLEHRGWVPAADVDAFHAAGFTRAHILELITLVAQKTISNYANHLAQTPVDAAFAPFAWSGEPAHR